MLARLRHGAVVDRHCQQGEVDRSESGQHVMNETLVARHIHKADGFARRNRQISESEVDRHAALFLLGQTIGVDASQCLDQQRLAVIDVACSSDDHRSVAPG